jgi:penicillin G amidase
MRHSLLALAALALCCTPAAAQNANSTQPVKLDGLKAAAEVTRDIYGIAHIRAGNDADLYFLQGYVHAQDRLFQMDVNRRRASGTLADLLGPSALAGDVELRTIGIRRAAERSLAVVSPESRQALEAYAKGVNAYVAAAGALPPEYAALELKKFQPWTALDSMTVAKSITFSLSFGLDDIDNTIALQTYTAVFDPVLGAGTGYKLFSQDLWRSQPFTMASTVPDASLAPAGAATAAGHWHGASDAPTAALAHKYAQRVRDLPFFKDRMNRDQRPGSNQWAVSGWQTVNGLPMVANDPHLGLEQPSTFYPNHLTSGDSDAMGNSFAGAPFVVVGQTQRIAWGATVSPLDVTDIFQEQVVPDPHSPSGLSTLYKGALEPVIPIPETYRFNPVGDGVFDDLVTVPPGGPIPAATLIVPRRNNGPIVQLDLATGAAISVQYTGFSGTREVDALRAWNHARNFDDFKRGVQWFDSGTQNLAYADVDGNVAYFSASEVPLREDLQSGTVTGLPPWFIRNGQGGNEWLPVVHPQPGQAIPYEILPASEMPHLLNPPAGWFVNANNDPAGTVLDNNPLNQLRPGGGLYYLNAGYDMGLRAGRITELLKSKLAAGPVSFADMQAIQADVVLPDAPVFAPYVQQAYAHAKAPSAHPLLAALANAPGVPEATSRLAAWSFKAPTGIEQGYDASDVNGVLGAPTAQEIADSVAATLYTVWRSRFIANTIDATLGGVPLPPGVSLPKPGNDQTMTALKALLERPQPGVGVSGLNFFNVPGVVSAADRRDILVLKSLADGLAQLAGPAFSPAFAGSTTQIDYRWGKLHRIVFKHPLGGAFNVPTVNPLGNALPGFPTDGGFGSVDVARFDLRAEGANEFMFTRGPVNRFVAEAGKPVVRAESAWPGGTSGVPGNPFYSNLLSGYLTNDSVPLLIRQGDLHKATSSVSRFVPVK